MRKRERKKMRKINVCMYVSTYDSYFTNKKEKRILHSFFWFTFQRNIYIYLYTCRSLDLRSPRDLFMMSSLEKKIGNVYIIFKGFMLMSKSTSEERKDHNLLFFFCFKIHRHLFIPLMNRYHRYHGLNIHFYDDCWYSHYESNVDHCYDMFYH
jgi:hypothetical protein